MELTPSKVLLCDTPVLSMECNGQHQMIHGCNFCIFDVPGQSRLSSTDFYLPPRLISCNNDTDRNITKLHPINLVLLQEFFDTAKFQHIFGDSTFEKPLNVTLPTFKIYNHKMSQILADDFKNHLNLSKMVEVTKNDDIVFQTLAEPMLDGQITIQSSWPDFNGVLILIAISFTSASTFLLLWVFFTIRKLSAALLLLQQVHHANLYIHFKPSAGFFLFQYIFGYNMGTCELGSSVSQHADVAYISC